MDYVAMGKKIKIRRVIMELTQEQLAEKVWISTSFMGHIERGTRALSVDTLYNLCAALGVSADYLMGLQ